MTTTKLSIQTMIKKKKFSIFSVHSQIIQKSGSWVFGHFYFIIDDKICGDFEDHAALNIVFDWIEDYLQAGVKLDDQRLSILSDRELVAKLYDSYGVINISGLKTETSFTGDSPYSISYLGMSAFDDWMILLIEFSGHQRLI